MLLDWLPRITLNEFAVPARKGATVGKLKLPVPCLKLLLRNWRYSPPPFNEWFPRWWLKESATIKVVSARPDGLMDGPPKFRPPATLICGKPIGLVIP